MTRIELDEAGFPVLLENANKTASPVGSSAPNPTPVTESLEFTRRRDAVREAAREFEDLSDQDIKERLKGVTNRELSDNEIALFRQDVRAQILDDLVDVVDQATRGKLRSRRTVRVIAPKGYRRKTLNGLSEAERSEIKDRLQARGWTEHDILGTGIITNKLVGK